jgi:hypothetical protein
MDSKIKTALATALIVFNLLFVSMFFLFAGYVIGSVSAEGKLEKGLADGYKRGKYEVYLELEKRKIGMYNSETDKFDFYEPKK